MPRTPARLALGAFMAAPSRVLFAAVSGATCATDTQASAGRNLSHKATLLPFARQITARRLHARQIRLENTLRRALPPHLLRDIGLDVAPNTPAGREEFSHGTS